MRTQLCGTLLECPGTPEDGPCEHCGEAIEPPTPIDEALERQISEKIKTLNAISNYLLHGVLPGDA